VLLSWFDSSVDSLSEIAKMLTGRGYQVTQANSIDPAVLRTLPSQPVGILYINTHGLLNPPTVAPQSQGEDADNAPPPALTFGIATSLLTSATQASLGAAAWAALQADINATDANGNPQPRLVPGVGPVMTRGSNGLLTKTGTRSVFFATNAFFQFYWASQVFAENSLVFVNGCLSADDTFQQTCTAAGGGLVLGWTMPVKSEDGAATADYIFDRMLGANDPLPQFFRETLHQRPFDWNTAQLEMKNHKSLLGSPLGTSFAPFMGQQVDVSLSPVVNGSSGLLVPSIVYIGIDEIGKHLFVNGEFGSVEGKVNLCSSLSASSGTPLNVETWTGNMITCTLPAPGDSGGTSGYVIVTVNGISSNCIPLSEWNGTLVTTAKGGGNLNETITMTYRLRLDGHHYRTDFSSLLSSSSYTPIPVFAFASQDSTCTYLASGQADLPSGGTETLSGNGELPPQSSMTRSATAASMCFDVVLELDSQFDGSLNETHTITMSGVLPIDDGSGDYDVTVVTQQPGQAPETSTFYAFTIYQYGPQVLVQKGTSYDLPDPGAPPPTGIGGMWTSEVLDVNNQTLFAPIPTLGEDYLPIITTSG
jgi:hypothetical protein